MRLLPTHRLGLRARLTVSFALGALLLSAILSFTAWGLTRQNLLAQRDETAEARAFNNASYVSKGLGSKAGVEKLIASLPKGAGAQPVIYYQNEWTCLLYTSDAADE